MEFVVVAAYGTGADLVETQATLASWSLPILPVCAVTFASGTVLVAVVVARSASFIRLPMIIVAGAALVVFGLSRVVPVGVVHFYVQSVAALAPLLPLAVAIVTARQGAVPVDLRCLIILAKRQRTADELVASNRGGAR